MAQRTGRSVSSGVAHVTSKGKTSKTVNTMQPGVPQPMRIGDTDPSDCSHGNDGSGAAAAIPGNAHKAADSK